MFADIEGALKHWASTNNRIGPAVTHGNRVHVYQSMPAASPRPSLIIQRVAGGPYGGGDLPQDMSRISFDCWGSTRETALTVSRILVEELDQLGPLGGYALPGCVLGSASIVLWTWAPDIRIDYPRYIVDARIWSLTTN